MNFPRNDTQDIRMRRYLQPQDLAGEFNLLMLSYAGWQQHCDTWLPFAGRFEEAFPAFQYYEISVIDQLNLDAKIFVD